MYYEMEVNHKVTPAGRPPKQGRGEPIAKPISARLTLPTIKKLEECEKILNVTRTAAVEKAIDILYETVAKK